MVATILLAAGVGFIGSFAGPRWEPTLLTTPLIPQTADLAIPGSENWPREGTYQVTHRELEIDLGSVTVPAWLYEPVDAPPGPGVVFLHGAGTVGPDAFQGQVKALASAGIRALVPAKRTDTYSTRQRDYVDMARDYLHSWEYLRGTPGVQPDRVGFYAESEGAWIGPVAAAEESEVAFVVLASAPVVSPREQAAYASANYLYNTNVPRAMFRAIPRALGAKIPGGGFEYADFDVVPYVEQMNQPILMAYGTGDASMPTIQGAHIVMNAAGGENVTVRYFQDADHGLKVDDQLAVGVNDVLVSWVWTLPPVAPAEAHVAGATPQQRFLAEQVPQPRWYASGDLLVYSALAVIALSLAGIALTVVSASRRNEWGPVTRHAIATTLAAFAVIALFVGYAGQVADLAVNQELDDALVLGGWMLIQATGLFAVTIAVLSIRQAHMAWKTGRLLSTSTRSGVWACHLGALSMLIMAAYWGVFPGAG